MQYLDEIVSLEKKVIPFKISYFELKKLFLPAVRIKKY